MEKKIAQMQKSNNYSRNSLLDDYNTKKAETFPNFFPLFIVLRMIIFLKDFQASAANMKYQM
jgi:hypothetical protein